MTQTVNTPENYMVAKARAIKEFSAALEYCKESGYAKGDMKRLTELFEDAIDSTASALKMDCANQINAYLKIS